MIIHNRRLNIDSTDVETCDDLTTLLKWKLGVLETYHSIIEKLVEVRAMKSKTGAHADRDWYNRTDKARRLQEMLILQIEIRINELKNK